MTRERVFLNCPEAYEIERLYDLGLGCTRIADAVDRDPNTMDHWLRGDRRHRRLVNLIGRRLSNGIRPKRELVPIEVSDE